MKHPLNNMVFICVTMLLFVNNIQTQSDFFSNMINNLVNVIGMRTARNEQFVSDTTKFYAEYDFIVVGSGSGGSVVANRLTEMPDWSVLLIEAGEEESILTDVPLSAALIQSTGYNWGYKAEPNPNFCRGLEGKRCNWPQGKALGGTSTVNFMVHARGNKYDFDQWERLGNPGWSYKDILPYFVKSEKSKLGKFSETPYRGKDGYLNVEYAPYKTPLIDCFLRAGREFGYNNTDPNGESQLGFSEVQATIRAGRRCSASKAYLRPIRDRPNLHITKRARVTKILIDPNTKRAYGVEFVKNKINYMVKVRKEVILSAGALNSPKLLMLSGVGPRQHLELLGIPVLQDLKVGYNLQDHVSLSGLAFTVNESITIIEQRALSLINLYNYTRFSQGPYTVPGGSMGIAFVKTKYNDNSERDLPDMELVMGGGALSGDTSGSLRQLLGIPDSFYKTVYQGIINKDAFSIVPILMNVKSRGRLMLKSSNPFHWPLLYPNYFSDERDIKVLIEGAKMAVQIGRSKSFQRYNATLHTTPYPGCEHLQFESDAYWECCIRQITITLSHYSGTCRMGPKNDPEGSVVDHTLRVHGITGLRVVDASIMPLLITGHPNAAVFMIGEKASDMIKETWLNTV